MDLNQGTPRPSASFPHALPKAHPRCTLVPQNQKRRNHTPHRPPSHRRPHPEVQACSLRSCRPYGPTGPSPCISQALQGHRNGSQSPTWLEAASRSATHDLVRPAKEGQWETSIDTLDLGSRQIAVEEGRDGPARLCDLVVVVENCHYVPQDM